MINERMGDCEKDLNLESIPNNTTEISRISDSDTKGYLNQS